MTYSERKTAIFISLSIVLLTSSFVAVAFAFLSNSNSTYLKYEVNDVFVGTVRHTIQITNPSSNKLTGTLIVPIIRNATARHFAILYEISSSKGTPKISTDNSGNIYASWNEISIGSQQEFTVELSYRILSFSVHYTINSSLVADYDNNSDLFKKYTQPEELIQSNHPKIIEKALNLTANEISIHNKVYKIYNFVVKHLKYAIQEQEQGALWALENGVGDCSEYSYLFVALCRAARIPARIQVGFAFGSTDETLENGHMWAEYYLENYGWIPVDATWRLFDKIDERHFSAMQSIPESIPYTNYAFNYTTEAELREEQTVSIKSGSSSIFNDKSYAESITKTVQKISQTKTILFLGKIFGTALMFRSEVENTEQTLNEGQIQLQAAIESWNTSPQIAQSEALNALETADASARNATFLVAQAFTVIIAVLMAIAIISLIIIRHLTKQKKSALAPSAQT